MMNLFKKNWSDTLIFFFIRESHECNLSHNISCLAECFLHGENLWGKPANERHWEELLSFPPFACSIILENVFFFVKVAFKCKASPPPCFMHFSPLVILYQLSLPPNPLPSSFTSNWGFSFEEQVLWYSRRFLTYCMENRFGKWGS